MKCLNIRKILVRKLNISILPINLTQLKLNNHLVLSLDIVRSPFLPEWQVRFVNFLEEILRDT